MSRDQNKRCLRLGLASNLALVGIKLSVGIIGASQALLADGVNSLLDVVAGGVALIGYGWSKKPADRDHPYGHHSIETIAAFITGVAILATGGIIIRDAMDSLLNSGSHVPQWWTALAAGFVIIWKTALYRDANKVAVTHHSPAVFALAADHKSDIIATGGVLIGVTGARLGWPILDPLAAIWVAGLILFHSFRVLRQTGLILSGAAPPERESHAIMETLNNVDGVLGLHRLNIRNFGSRMIVDAEILVDANLSVQDAHQLATQAKNKVKSRHPRIADVIVHVEPYSSRRAVEGTDPLRPRERSGPLESGSRVTE